MNIDISKYKKKPKTRQEEILPPQPEQVSPQEELRRRALERKMKSDNMGHSNINFSYLDAFEK